MNSVVVSLDTEIAWGFHDVPNPPRRRISVAREAAFRLVDLFERERIPATWAIVGHLFLDRCDGRHPGHPLDGDWFARDPGGDRRTQPEWFGGDLVARIRDSPVAHEIGSHSFSHVEFGASGTTRDVARAEVEASIELAREYGIDLESFVFPRNNVGHREVLAEYGFTCYRGIAPERWYDGMPIRPIGKAMTYALGSSSPPIVRPRIDRYGLVDIPASMDLFTFEGAARSFVEPFSGDPVLRQVRLGLDKLAARDDGVLHLWLHPNNVVSGEDMRRVESVVDLLVEYRETAGIEITTMGQVANAVRRTGRV